MLVKVGVSLLLMGGLMASARLCGAEGQVHGSVLLLRQSQCCPQNAWIGAEEALLEEFTTIELRTQSLEIPEEIAPAIEPTLLGYAAEHKADVVLMITCAPAEVCRADMLIQGKDANPSFRQMLFEGEQTKQLLATLTLRVTEAVRAELIPVPPAPEPKMEEPIIPPDPPGEESKPPRLSLGIGAGLHWSPGGVGPSAALTWNAAVRLVASLYIETDGSWGFATRDLKQAELAASFETLLFRGSLYWQFHWGQWVHPALGLGAGVMVISTRGESGGAASTSDDQDTVAYLGMASATRFEITDSWGVLLVLNAGMLIPRAAVYFASDLVAQYGWPLLEGSLCLDWRFL